MAKNIDLPLRGTAEYQLAHEIWEHIAPGNPHGPQSDLYFEMPYVRDSAERVTRIARDLIEKGWRPQWGLQEKVSAEDLAKRGRPDVILPAEGIVALVDEISTTIDMTIEQALDLRLLLGIPGHASDLYLATGEELWLRCTCGKFDIHVGSDQDDLEALCRAYTEHLKQILARPKLKDLPDGIYFDGTYEWAKDGREWTPLEAPQGMPRWPEIEKLKRVKKTYEEIA